MSLVTDVAETSESADAVEEEKTNKKPLIISVVVILAIVLCGLAMMTGKRKK